MTQSPSKTPAEILLMPKNGEYQKENRGFQGIPSIEKSPEGKLYCVFYGGVREEKAGNFGIVVRSLDGGNTWTDPFIIIRHPDKRVRIFDPNIWLDPNGKLWLFWSQSEGYNDGRHGVWAVVCDNCDVSKPVFSSPRRIANGVMLNKPTVLSDGTWLLPTAVWVCKPYPEIIYTEVIPERFSNVLASTDQGWTFKIRGGANVENRCFDEHMVIEKLDRSLWMLVRLYDGIGEAFSNDQGRTWYGERKSSIPGPCSRFFIRRLQSGRILLVNHVGFSGKHTRENLMAQLSEDEGQTWIGGLMIDPRLEVSYPDGTQLNDGRICIVHDRGRIEEKEVLLSIFREEDILAGQCVSKKSRLRNVVSKASGILEE